MKLILGMGLTGLSVARFFSSNNVDYRIADSRLSPPMQDICIKENLLSDCHLGEWKESLLDNITEIIISPGIAETESIVGWARLQKIPVISDIELFGRYTKAPIVGITGSNGKSTVTQLLGEMSIGSGKNAVICGNIGKPVMESLSDEAELYVVELSSYQLDYTNSLNLLTGVVTNITPDHLDRYPDYDIYIASKLNLYEYCQYSVVNLNEPLVKGVEGDSSYAIEEVTQSCEFSAKKVDGVFTLYQGEDILMTSNDLMIVGRHNVENVLAALTLGHQVGLSVEEMIQVAKSFTGLPHRLEWVANLSGVDYFNNSKSTNAISTITAIEALSDRYKSIVLIAGGIAKKEDYSKLFQLISEKINAVILIGESATLFSQQINGCPVSIVESMKQAVISSKAIAKEGAILLSPGCASFDMFVDFNERGEVFKRHVLEDNKDFL
jgi:UDP-N-acetylmuramoylalanine--D-glutamate ligase